MSGFILALNRLIDMLKDDFKQILLHGSQSINRR